jgi:hypothetical protein
MRAAESLDQGHGSAHRIRARQAGFADQMARYRAIDDAEHLRDHLGTRRQQIAQRKRQRQDPLANRMPRQDPFDEQRRRLGNCSCIDLPRAFPALVGHPPGTAARTEAAALATERNQLLGLPKLTLDPKKSVLKQAAFEIGFELVFDVPRQRSPLGHPPIPEPGIVLGHGPGWSSASFFDQDEGRIEPGPNPFAPENVATMSPE